MEENYDEEHGDETDPGKAKNELFRNFKEEPGDDDGENRSPQKRTSVLSTSFLIAKTILGAGTLNMPLLYKTFGIIFGILFGFTFSFISANSCYLLLKCKDITQRYSYSVYSKIIMGTTGTILNKTILIMVKTTFCCVYFVTIGNLVRSLALFFIKPEIKLLSEPKAYVVFSGLVLLAFMFQKDITKVSKFAFLGLFAVIILFLSLIIILIYKINNGEIQSFESRILYPSESKYNLLKIFGGFFNSFVFQTNFFPMYLPLQPRNTKNMMKSCVSGLLIASIIYSLFGLIGFTIYRYDINASLIKSFDKDLIQYKSKSKFIVGVIIISEIAFLINICISEIICFFVAKENTIGFIKLLFGKFQFKKTQANEGVPLVDLDEKGDEVKEYSKKETKESIGSSMKNVITLLLYIFIIFVASSSDKIITIETFNGSTVSNYMTLIAPGIFYLSFSKGQPIDFAKCFSVFSILFGIFLMVRFFVDIILF